MMKEEDIQNEIIDYSKGLELIGTELEWILKVVNDNDPKQDDPLAEEMIGKFYSLYADFVRLRYEIFQLMKKVLLVEDTRFTSPSSKKTYIEAIEKLLKTTTEGKFSDFIHVAETGKLRSPEGSDLK